LLGLESTTENKSLELRSVIDSERGRIRDKVRLIGICHDVAVKLDVVSSGVVGTIDECIGSLGVLVRISFAADDKQSLDIIRNSCKLALLNNRIPGIVFLAWNTSVNRVPIFGTWDAFNAVPFVSLATVGINDLTLESFRIPEAIIGAWNTSVELVPIFWARLAKHVGRIPFFIRVAVNAVSSDWIPAFRAFDAAVPVPFVSVIAVQTTSCRVIPALFTPFALSCFVV